MNRARVTIRDVAEHAGVSFSTVSNVLNSPSIVTKRTRDKVEQAIEELGFVRDGVARHLRAGRGSTIGFVAFDIGNPLFATVARAIEDVVTERGYLVILCDAAGSIERERKQLTLLEEQRVAGILYTAVESKESSAIGRLRENNVAVVRLGVPLQRRDRCCVSNDEKQGGRLAAEHLLELGHERIGMIGGPLALTPSRRRREGFLRGLVRAGLQLRAEFDVEAAEMTMLSGEEAARRLFAGKKHPTAVFCHNDLIAFGALRALAARGLRVPEDVAVVGHDDIPFAEMSTVPLTSVRPRTDAIARNAVELLLEEMAGEHEHRRIVLEPELVIRESTLRSAAIGVDDPVNQL
jgi:LacI family transcriptional regulator